MSRHFIKNFCKFFLFLTGFCTVVAGVATIILYGIYRQNLPEVLDAKTYRPHLNSRVYDINGKLIAEFGGNYRIFLENEDISSMIKKAFISSEDKNFYHHSGIDFVGILKALVESAYSKRQQVRGASTITQQLAKSLLIAKEGFEKGSERSLSRKIKEAILARKLELHLSKDEILWIYLNEVYLGQGAYGIEAAARAYFKKNAKNLNIAETAIIAGLPQAPSRYSPINNPKLAFARQQYVLSRMLEEKVITKAQYEEALEISKDLRFYERKNTFLQSAPYFSEHIRKEFSEKYGNDLYEKGFSIHTTLNIDHQKIMQKVLGEHLAQVDRRQGYDGPLYRNDTNRSFQQLLGIVKKTNENNLLELPEGFFVALVTQVEPRKQEVVLELGFSKGKLPLEHMRWARKADATKNFALNLLRSVEGVFEPNDIILVEKVDDNTYALRTEPKIEGTMVSVDHQTGYVTALMGGYSFKRSQFNRYYQSCRQPGSIFKPIIYSAGMEFNDYLPSTMIMDTPLTFRNMNTLSSWKPKNFGERYRGEVTFRDALIHSMNVPTLNVAASVGIKKIKSWAKHLGIDTPLKSELGIAIGSSCISPYEIQRFYSHIANLGLSKEEKLIKEIINLDGERILFNSDKLDPYISRDARLSLLVKEAFNYRRVLSKEKAYIMHQLLRDAATYGTARRTNVLNRHIAAKTGTTNDSFDTWFAGYTTALTSIIWVGFDEMNTPLGAWEQGARTTTPIFIDYTKEVLPGLMDTPKEMPEELCEAYIDSKTGFQVEKGTAGSFKGIFPCGQEPQLLESAQKTRSLDQALDVLMEF